MNTECNHEPECSSYREHQDARHEDFMKEIDKEYAKLDQESKYFAIALWIAAGVIMGILIASVVLATTLGGK